MAVEDAGPRLEKLTLVESSAQKLPSLQEAIVALIEPLEGEGLSIKYDELTREQLVEFEREELRERSRQLDSIDARGRRDRSNLVPTRLTLSRDRGVYTIGAITDTASIPERAIPLDPALVEQANDELAGEWDHDLQCERGKLLERLLIPDDLRPRLAGNAPIVMLLDSTTARIHWEMVSQSEPAVAGGDGDGQQQGSDLTNSFLGTSRGLTRQLRTTFAPPPDPPPPPRRVLRVLVVADPAADRPLQGAMEEGVAVADLFESFTELVPASVESRIEVVRLFGPSAATRTAVMRHLAVRSYDVLHYAGHCVYDENKPATRGGCSRTGAVEPQRAQPHRPHPEVRLLERVRVGHHAGPRRSALARTGAELRGVILRARRGELRVHSLAGERPRRTRLRLDAVCEAARAPRPGRQ